MTTDDAFRAYSTTVRDGWLDYNGHLTDWAYAVVYAQANEAFLDWLGVSVGYRERTGCTTYTVESHIRYLAEVREGATLRAESRLVEADTKRLRVLTTLRAADGRTVATGEYLYLHVDQRAGRVVPFPPDRAEVIRRTLESHGSADQRPRRS